MEYGHVSPHLHNELHVGVDATVAKVLSTYLNQHTGLLVTPLRPFTKVLAIKAGRGKPMGTLFVYTLRCPLKQKNKYTRMWIKSQVVLIEVLAQGIQSIFSSTLEKTDIRVD
jgi:hypothetical protein